MSLDDQQFSRGISLGVEKFYDDVWVFIYPSTLVFDLDHPVPTLLYISAMSVSLLSLVFPLLLYFLILLHVHMLRLKGGVGMMVNFTCSFMAKRPLYCITTLWLKNQPSRH